MHNLPPALRKRKKNIDSSTLHYSPPPNLNKNDLSQARATRSDTKNTHRCSRTRNAFLFFHFDSKTLDCIEKEKKQPKTRYFTYKLHAEKHKRKLSKNNTRIPAKNCTVFELF